MSPPVDFGMDLSLAYDLTEEMRTVTGLTLLSEALIRRWSTPRGMLLDDEDYGTDLAEYLNEDVDALALARIRSEVVAEALKDERVIECAVIYVKFLPVDNAAGGRIEMQLESTVPETTFRLTLAVSAVTVELLKVEE